MKEALKRIVDTFHQYNTEHMAAQAFGLREDIVYDALVIAPSFTPYKLHMDEYCSVTTLKEGAYIAGYLVESDNLRIAWIKMTATALRPDLLKYPCVTALNISSSAMGPSMHAYIRVVRKLEPSPALLMVSL